MLGLDASSEKDAEDCPACQGKHRAHTCGMKTPRLGNDAEAAMDEKNRQPETQPAQPAQPAVPRKRQRGKVGTLSVNDPAPESRRPHSNQREYRSESQQSGEQKKQRTEMADDLSNCDKELREAIRLLQQLAHGGKMQTFRVNVGLDHLQRDLFDAATTATFSALLKPPEAIIGNYDESGVWVRVKAGAQGDVDADRRAEVLQIFQEFWEAVMRGDEVSPRARAERREEILASVPQTSASAAAAAEEDEKAQTSGWSILASGTSGVLLPHRLPSDQDLPTDSEQRQGVLGLYEALGIVIAWALLHRIPLHRTLCQPVIVGALLGVDPVRNAPGHPQHLDLDEVKNMILSGAGGELTSSVKHVFEADDSTLASELMTLRSLTDLQVDDNEPIGPENRESKLRQLAGHLLFGRRREILLAIHQGFALGGQVSSVLSPYLEMMRPQELEVAFCGAGGFCWCDIDDDDGDFDVDEWI